MTDAYLNGQLDGAIFDRWRAMMHATMRAGIGYVVVMQQQTCDNLLQALQARPDDPSWRLMDVGLSLQLRPLLADDVRRLIEWPMRNHLEYTPEVVTQIATLSGGSPFLIQAFCHNLVLHMARQQRQQVTRGRPGTGPPGVYAAARPYLCAHDRDAQGHHQSCGGHDRAAGRPGRPTDQAVSSGQVRAALPNVAPESLGVSLRMLVEHDILVQPAPERWQFASLLFQQWLAING